ncbi:MAG: hypothetical protein HQL36_03035 [Alphaproteobacteria bacterium]|nr:hypothetical protein [Alphaproteobacteria bacterium]
MSGNTLIISMHPKGFPNADYYIDGEHFTDFDWQNGVVPDGYMTGKKGESLTDFEVQAIENFPDANVYFVSAPDDEMED